MTGAGRGHRPVCPQGKRERAGPGAAGWRHAEQPRCWAGRGDGVTGDRTGSVAPRCPWKPRSRRCVEPQAERPRACATPPVGDVPGPSTVLFAGRRGQCRAAPAEPQRPGRLRRVFTEDAGRASPALRPRARPPGSLSALVPQRHEAAVLGAPGGRGCHVARHSATGSAPLTRGTSGTPICLQVVRRGQRCARPPLPQYGPAMPPVLGTAWSCGDTDPGARAPQPPALCRGAGRSCWAHAGCGA